MQRITPLALMQLPNRERLAVKRAEFAALPAHVRDRIRARLAKRRPPRVHACKLRNEQTP